MIRTIPLLSGYSTSNMTSPFVTPEMPRNIEDALVMVTVESVTGSPTTATITPSFEVWHSHVGGNQEEVILGGSGTSPLDSWFTIQSAQNPSMLPDGAWPTALDVSTAVVATPISTFRRIGGGFPWRLKIAWNLAGGSTPTLTISAIAYVRELPAPGFDRMESGS